MGLPDHKFDNKATDALRDSEYEDIGAYLGGKVADGSQGLEHISPWQASGFAIILHSNAIVGFSRSFLNPELHLCGQMIKSIFCGMDEFQLILNIALIILFLKGLDDFGVFFLFELNVHMFDVLFQQLFMFLIGLGVGLYF